MSDVSKNYYRRLSAIFLGVALLMLLLGETLLRDTLAGLGLVIFWTVCFGFTLLAMLMAFLDLSALQRRARQQHRELLENAVTEIVREKTDRTRRPPGASE
jgi:heme/copper-type cytochrome/quinol oxidase subunit 1